MSKLLSAMPKEKLPKGAVCPLCMWILEKPKACHHCQQSFCESCLLPWLKHTPNCPKCEGFVTPKILLDTSALVDSLLLDYAYRCLPEYPLPVAIGSPERKSKRNLLAFIEALRAKKAEFQEALVPQDQTPSPEKKKKKSAAELVGTIPR